MIRIPVAGPWITQKELDYVADAAATAWYENANKYVSRFEAAFAAYVDVPYAVAVPSCTSAIHLALAAIGVGPGDEVIVPDCTWIASAAPIEYLGAVPVFADVDKTTWCLAADAVEECLTARTRAIIAVDLYGGLPDWDALHAIGSHYGIPIIEDAAEAIGSEFRGAKAGSLADVGTFSFHGSKTLTTGEGGMLVTGRRELFERVLTLRDHGRPPGDRFFQNTEVAYKYKMSNLQAAMGLAQLERVDELIGRKRELFTWYQHRLKDLEGVQLNNEPPDTKNSYWMSSVVLDERWPITTREIMSFLERQGVDSRPFFSPLSCLPAFARRGSAKRAAQRNHVSRSLSRAALNLPSALSLTEHDVDTVCTAFKDCLSQTRAQTGARVAVDTCE